MSANFYELLKYANTGIASPEMTYFDKMRALSMTGGGTIKTLTGIPPLSFTGNGKPLISWSMLGNTQQTGTPSPDNIIMPDFCGKLVGTDWTIPLTCAGQTTPVYLGQTQTVRRVKKLVLTGEETFSAPYGNSIFYATSSGIGIADHIAYEILCTHFARSETNFAMRMADKKILLSSAALYTRMDAATTVSDFKSYLAQQYANGTPVTVWYVLATPETAIVNEPLAKIGDYADELHSSDAAVTIPTANGDNTLTVDTDLQPSSMTITGHIK